MGNAMLFECPGDRHHGAVTFVFSFLALGVPHAGARPVLVVVGAGRLETRALRVDGRGQRGYYGGMDILYLRILPLIVSENPKV
jgi:hypothetical protein